MATNSLQNLRLALDLVSTSPAAPPGGKKPAAFGITGASKPPVQNWARHPNIQGFGIAERITQGQKLKDVALKVYVERKLPAGKLDSPPVPKQVMLAGMSTPVDTDVQEIGKVVLEANTSRHRPAMPGCGLGHFEVTAGTFGCLVRKKGKPELYILSNSHVLANSGTGKAGDVILQSAVFDGGVQPADVLCKLTEWVPFKFGDAFDNLVDAAIAQVKPTDVTSKVNLIGVAPKGVGTVVRRGMKVKKVGRTTDLTSGEITDVDFRTSLPYPKPDGSGDGNVGMRDQVLCTRYTAGGDSGAAVFNTKNQIVGLHFAGTPSTSIFNRITNVLDALGLEIVTEAI